MIVGSATSVLCRYYFRFVELEASSSVLQSPAAGSVGQLRLGHNLPTRRTHGSDDREVAHNRLALGQDRHRGVIAVQPLGGKDIALNQPIEP